MKTHYSRKLPCFTHLDHVDFVVKYSMCVTYHRVPSKHVIKSSRTINIFDESFQTFTLTFSICSSAQLNAFCNSALKFKQMNIKLRVFSRFSYPFCYNYHFPIPVFFHSPRKGVIYRGNDYKQTYHSQLFF